MHKSVTNLGGGYVASFSQDAGVQTGFYYTRGKWQELQGGALHTKEMGSEYPVQFIQPEDGINMTKHLLLASFMAASVILSGCGDPATSDANIGDQPRSEVGADSSARGFIQREEAELLAACETATVEPPEVKSPPTTTKEGPVIEGFVPIVGPDCATGYLARDAAGPADRADVPVGVEAVRDRPAASAAIVGYVIPGSVGWIAAEEITSSGFALTDLVAAAEEIQADRERQRAVDPAE